MFRRQPDSLIGLDIGSTSVKLMELSRRDGQLRLESCGSEPVPSRAGLETHTHTSGTHISDAQSVGEAIKRLAGRTRPKTKSAAVAIGGSAAFTKVIIMDASLSDDEMEGEIALQAADHLPYPSAEALIDFEVLHLSERDPTQVEVLLAACRRDDAELLEAATAMGGFRARVLDIEAFAIARALNRLQPDFDARSDIAIFDIGADSSTLSVFVDDKLAHTREEAFGARSLTEEMLRHCSMSVMEAETTGSFVEAADESILSRFRDAVLEQMTRALQFFYSANPSERVDQVFLAGGVATLPSLADQAAHLLGMPVVIADPLADMVLGDTVDALELTRDAPEFTLACGLALRTFER